MRKMNTKELLIDRWDGNTAASCRRVSPQLPELDVSAVQQVCASPVWTGRWSQEQPHWDQRHLLKRLCGKEEEDRRVCACGRAVTRSDRQLSRMRWCHQSGKSFSESCCVQAGKTPPLMIGTRGRRKMLLFKNHPSHLSFMPSSNSHSSVSIWTWEGRSRLFCP